MAFITIAIVLAFLFMLTLLWGLFVLLLLVDFVFGRLLVESCSPCVTRRVHSSLSSLYIPSFSIYIA